MSLFSGFAQGGRVKILVLVVLLASFGGALLSLDYITNRLLERDAFSEGMHWAEDMEANLENLDQIFAGDSTRSDASEILRQVSLFGRIYRYKFSNPDGKVVFDTGDISPAVLNSPEQHAGHSHKPSLAKGDVARPSLAERRHFVDLKTSDGSNHPKFYAHVVHPISKNGNYLGNLILYIDQTETQALLRDIIMAAFIVLSCVSVFAFGLPVFLYLRGKANARDAKNEFEQQQKRFDAALSVMRHGFCMFDDDNNVIISNDGYATIYGLSPDQIKPGQNLKEVAEFRIENGCHIGRDADDYRDIMSKIKSEKNGELRIYQLNDGRYVEIYDLLMAGGGWLTTHEDVTERRAAELRAKHQNEQFDIALSNITQGLCMFDGDKTLIVSNDRYAEIFGLSPDMIKSGMKLSEIIKLRTRYGSFVGENPTNFRTRADEWIDHLHNSQEVHQLTDGRYVEILFHPMADGGWLATQEDVTEKTQTKLAMALKNNQFDMAISNISQGLCLFDKNKKLIVSNDLYATIFALTPDMIKPGMHINEILMLRIEKGSFVSDSSQDAQTRVDNWHNIFLDDINVADKAEVFQLTNGRYVEILSRPMQDGGWLSTQQDVTDRIQTEIELTERNERLDAALSAMSHGLSMFDFDENIVVSNERYATIYGIGPDQIIPGMNLKEVVELRIANGCYIEDTPDEVRAKMKQLKNNRTGEPRTLDMNDGRYIEVRDHPMANGGWLSIHEDVTDRYVSEKKIRHLADYDTLTGLPNRSQIHDALHLAIQQALEDGTQIALLYIDLDGFKEINDTLGHPVGDYLLNEVGSRLTKLASDNIIAGRLSGDEFVMIVKEFGYQPFLERLASQICEALAAPIHVDHNVIEISASIGISIGPPQDGEVGTLFKFSDLALYQTKADGGNNYCFFEEDMYARAKERQRIAADLRNAIRNNELVLHYQPQVDFRSGDICGYEALVRWEHKELGMISPLNFIGLAEETGQISEIGEWVLRTACEYAVTWPNKEKISVNLSPVQFKRQDVITMVKRVLWDTGIEPERLELEITESVLIQSTDSVIITLRTLAEMGVSIALDDFGTGFSSLSYLTTFPFNKIKIDKSFIDDLGKDPEVTAIVSMIIGLGRSLDTIITAEGIEESRQHELLRAAGCDQGQGYLYGKPLPEILTLDKPLFEKQASLKEFL